MTDRREALRKAAAERSRRRRTAGAYMTTEQLLEAMKHRDEAKRDTVQTLRHTYSCPICKDRGGWYAGNGCPSCGAPPAS